MASQVGQVGITLNVNWGEPEDETNPEHLEASQRFMDFFLGWYANPIFVDGKYPEVHEVAVFIMFVGKLFPRS